MFDMISSDKINIKGIRNIVGKYLLKLVIIIKINEKIKLKNIIKTIERKNKFLVSSNT